MSCLCVSALKTNKIQKKNEQKCKMGFNRCSSKEWEDQELTILCKQETNCL